MDWLSRRAHLARVDACCAYESEAVMKINPSFVRILIAIGTAFAIICLSACQAGIRPVASIPTQSATVADGAPFVEAFLEYVGPPERWAGPRTVTLHLQARELEPASVLITPNPGMPVPRPGGGSVSAAGHIAQPVARDELRALGTTMIEAPATFTGCLYPIRARLVRADGTVLERTGCRANTGWPVAVSRVLLSVVETATVRVATPTRAQVE